MRLIFNKLLTGFDPGRLWLACAYTGETEEIAVDALVPLTSHTPVRALYDAILRRREKRMRARKYR